MSHCCRSLLTGLTFTEVQFYSFPQVFYATNTSVQKQIIKRSSHSDCIEPMQGQLLPSLKRYQEITLCNTQKFSRNRYLKCCCNVTFPHPACPVQCCLHSASISFFQKIACHIQSADGENTKDKGRDRESAEKDNRDCQYLLSSFPACRLHKW